MSLESIKKKLSDLGYHAYITTGDLIIGKKVGTLPEIGGISLTNFCMISKGDSDFLIEFGRTSVSETKSFPSEDKVIGFVKSEFPI